MRLTILIILLNLVYPARKFGQAEWKLRRDKEWMSICIREKGESPMKEYKARAIIANLIQQVFELTTDYQCFPEWVFRCAGKTSLKIRMDKGLYTRLLMTYPGP
jgi:hypothetical protein